LSIHTEAKAEVPQTNPFNGTLRYQRALVD